MFPISEEYYKEKISENNEIEIVLPTHFGQALSHSIAQYACEENLQSIMSRVSLEFLNVECLVILRVNKQIL